MKIKQKNTIKYHTLVKKFFFQISEILFLRQIFAIFVT